VILWVVASLGDRATARPTVAVDVRKISLDGDLRFVRALQDFMLKSGGGELLSQRQSLIASPLAVVAAAVGRGLFDSFALRRNQ